MARYAEDTTVSVESSRLEIERTLNRYGADAFAYGIDGLRARIAFRMKGRQYRFELTLPEPSDRSFTHTKNGQLRSEGPARSAWDQACRQRWRALSLYIKASLEAVESGIVLIEEAFFAQTVMPDGQTMGAYAEPQVRLAYETGQMPKLLQLEGPVS